MKRSFIKIQLVACKVGKVTRRGNLKGITRPLIRRGALTLVTCPSEAAGMKTHADSLVTNRKKTCIVQTINSAYKGIFSPPHRRGFHLRC